jgi:phosphatidate cytidylyltransferase
VIKRTFSTLGLWAGAIGLLGVFGAQGGVWLITAFALLAQHEFYAMLGKMGQRPFHRLGLFVGALLVLGPYYLEAFLPPAIVSELGAGLIALVVIAGCLRILKERKADERVETLAATVFGLVYIPFMLHFLVRLLLLPAAPTVGIGLALWLIATAKFCDVGALLTGMALGRHKMAPSISPNKTWEGAAGGVALSAGVAALIVALFPAYYPPVFTPLLAALLAVPLAAAAIVSDLVESIIKRRAAVKDSGAMVPGIGGAFDLIDSLILVAPLGYFMFLFLQAYGAAEF